jgi:hypothetical protein
LVPLPLFFAAITSLFKIAVLPDSKATLFDELGVANAGDDEVRHYMILTEDERRTVEQNVKLGKVKLLRRVRSCTPV